MMTIDERIEKETQGITRLSEELKTATIEQYIYYCQKEKREHEDLVKWLNELKDFRQASEHFRWHNISKHPDDLPDNSPDTPILVKFANNQYATGTFTDYQFNLQPSTISLPVSEWRYFK